MFSFGGRDSWDEMTRKLSETPLQTAVRHNDYGAVEEALDQQSRSSFNRGVTAGVVAGVVGYAFRRWR